MIWWVNGTVKVDILNGSYYIADLLCGLINEYNSDHKKKYFSNKKIDKVRYWKWEMNIIMMRNLKK